MQPPLAGSTTEVKVTLGISQNVLFYKRSVYFTSEVSLFTEDEMTLQLFSSSKNSHISSGHIHSAGDKSLVVCEASL